MPDPLQSALGFTADDAAVAGDRLPAVMAFRLMTAAAARLKRQLDEAMADSGLTSQQGFLLTLIRQLGAPRLSDVAQAMGSSHQNVKQIAAALAAKGMVELRPDPDDRRATRLVLVEGALTRWQDRRDADYDTVAAGFARLSPAELADLVRLVAALIGLPAPAAVAQGDATP
jgi:DNA-binding MarR family transcriptional regulator